MAAFQEVCGLPEAEQLDVLAAQSGDADAFVRLIYRHESAVRHLLLRFSDDRGTIQDLCQETYLEAFRSLSSYRYQGSFAGWLRRIAIRTGYRHWGRQAREAKAKSAFVESCRNGPEPDKSCVDHESVDLVHCALGVLGQRDRVLVELRYFKGMKAAEIALSMGWSVTRVRVRLHRAIKTLREEERGCGRSGRKRR